jgi:hypothetical protein
MGPYRVFTYKDPTYPFLPDFQKAIAIRFEVPDWDDEVEFQIRFGILWYGDSLPDSLFRPISISSPGIVNYQYSIASSGIVNNHSESGTSKRIAIIGTLELKKMEGQLFSNGHYGVFADLKYYHKGILVRQFAKFLFDFDPKRKAIEIPFVD